MEKRFFVFVALLGLILGPCTTAMAAIHHVDVDAGGSNNGSSWTDAYTSLQSALTVAGSGDEVWVAEGTYYPSVEVGGTGDRYKTFQMKNGVGIYGGFTGGETVRSQRDPSTNVTILSGDIGIHGDDGDNSYHVFYHPDRTGLDSTAVLDGFTITDGNADGDDSRHRQGGGMHNQSSSPTLRDCTFTGNSASNGGGMYNYSFTSTLTNCIFSRNSARTNGGGMYNDSYDPSSPTLTNCVFIRNSAGYNGGSGGGMYNERSSSPTLTKCVFIGNRADSGGGMTNRSEPSFSPVLTDCTFSDNWADYSGGGMSNYSTLTLTNCSFIGNVTHIGGGMYNSYSASAIPTLMNCTFTDNSANLGGGVFNQSSPTLMNCTFTGNSARDEGGGMYNTDSSSSPMLTNCTFSDNWAGYRGGGMYNYTSYGDPPCSPTLTNCVMWGDAAPRSGPEVYNFNSTPIFSYCDIQGSGGSSDWDTNLGTDDGNNIDADPLFLGIGDNPYDLTAGSPCIDAGTPNGAPADDILGRPRGVFPDMGAYEYTSPTTGIIGGTVTDAAGTPMRALVAAVKQPTRASTLTQMPGGDYVVEDLEPGEYVVLAIKRGYETGIARITIAAGQTVTQDFQLAPQSGTVDASAALANYPNPFNPETWIPYQLHQPADVLVRIYDAHGTLVRTLDLGRREAGEHSSRSAAAHWDGRNEAGERVASGTYYYQLEAGDFTETRRMVILK